MSDAPLTISHAMLHTLHRIHRQMTDLGDQVNRGPRQVQAGQASIDAMTADLAQARETLKQAKIACDKKQLQLKEREQRVEDLGKKLNTAASNREFQLFKDQIAADQKANGVLADEILEALERIDQLTINVQTKDTELKQRQADHNSLVGELDAKMATLASELERVQAELAEAEKEIPAAIRETYDRLIRSNGEEGLAQVEGSSCSNCGATFAPQTLNRLMLSHFVCCPTCAAILYMKSEE